VVVAELVVTEAVLGLYVVEYVVLVGEYVENVVEVE
jgi:hypothetical protein